MRTIESVNAKLIINGKEIEVMISSEELKKLTFQKKTGYEQVPDEEPYYYISDDGMVEDGCEYTCSADEPRYNIGNYYSDKTVAENNARADRIMRKLRRFAVEHRKNEINWRNEKQEKYGIQYYNIEYEELEVVETSEVRHPFSIYFDSKEAAELAIDAFHDELIWYFTEYKDSM
jgi:hypothetical protein